MYVCMYVCMYMCVCVCMCISLTHTDMVAFICIRTRMYMHLLTVTQVRTVCVLCMYTCMYVFLSVCMYVCIYVRMCMYVYIYICIWICMFICICIFTQTYMHTHICTLIHSQKSSSTPAGTEQVLLTAPRQEFLVSRICVGCYTHYSLDPHPQTLFS